MTIDQFGKQRTIKNECKVGKNLKDYPDLEGIHKD